jgi:hypothetical protein
MLIYIYEYYNHLLYKIRRITYNYSKTILVLPRRIKYILRHLLNSILYYYSSYCLSTKELLHRYYNIIIYNKLKEYKLLLIQTSI